MVWGGPVESIRPGDRLFFEPEENHWHGADPHADAPSGVGLADQLERIVSRLVMFSFTSPKGRTCVHNRGVNPRQTAGGPVAAGRYPGLRVCRTGAYPAQRSLSG